MLEVSEKKKKEKKKGVLLNHPSHCLLFFFFFLEGGVEKISRAYQFRVLLLSFKPNTCISGFSVRHGELWPLSTKNHLWQKIPIMPCQVLLLQGGLFQHQPKQIMKVPSIMH